MKMEFHLQGEHIFLKELQGRPSFNSVLENVSKVYSENREKIISQVSQMQLVLKN